MYQSDPVNPRATRPSPPWICGVSTRARPSEGRSVGTWWSVTKKVRWPPSPKSRHSRHSTETIWAPTTAAEAPICVIENCAPWMSRIAKVPSSGE